MNPNRSTAEGTAENTFGGSVERSLDTAFAAAVLFDLAPTGIDVQLSEASLVARITTSDGDFAIKIFDAAEVDEPLTLWRHELAAFAAAEGLPVPAPVRAPSGELTVRARLDGRYVLAQTSGWSTGTAVADVPLDRALLHEIGAVAARLAVALDDAPPPPAHDMHLWDLRRSGVTLTETLSAVTNPETRIVGLRALRAFHSIERSLAELPRTVVHQDLHDGNLLIGPTPSGRSVVGILDFGDATFGPRIADLVIPAAYSSRHTEDAAQAIADVVAGWERIIPLTDEERAIVLPLSAMRLATNAAIWQSRSTGDRSMYAAERSQGSLSAARALLDFIE